MKVYSIDKWAMYYDRGQRTEMIPIAGGHPEEFRLEIDRLDYGMITLTQLRALRNLLTSIILEAESESRP